MPAGMSLLALQRRVFSSDLTPSARLVALAILDHWSPGRPLWPSVARLAALTGLAESSVKRLLRELSDAGAFAVERRGAGRRNHYTPGPLLTGGPGLTIGPDRAHHDPTTPANPGSPSDRTGLTMG